MSTEPSPSPHVNPVVTDEMVARACSLYHVRLGNPVDLAAMRTVLEDVLAGDVMGNPVEFIQEVANNCEDDITRELALSWLKKERKASDDRT